VSKRVPLHRILLRKALDQVTREGGI
jgi:hypothetical protein